MKQFGNNNGSGSGSDSIPGGGIDNYQNVGGNNEVVTPDATTSAPQSLIEETTTELEAQIDGATAHALGNYKTMTVDINIDEDEVDSGDAISAYEHELKKVLDNNGIIYKDIVTKTPETTQMETLEITERVVPLEVMEEVVPQK